MITGYLKFYCRFPIEKDLLSLTYFKILSYLSESLSLEVHTYESQFIQHFLHSNVISIGTHKIKITYSRLAEPLMDGSIPN